jgi:integrase
MAAPKHNRKEKKKMLGSEVCFEDAARAWIKSATTRSRKRMKDTTVPTIESALTNYIYTHIGTLPLSEIHNGTCKPIVDAMKEKGLSSATMSSYLNICKSVVKSVIDPVTGEPVFNRKWSAAFLDLPVIEHTKTPCIDAKKVETILSQTSKGSWEHRLFLVLASTGLRVSEALALEWKHLMNDGRTLVIEQQVSRFGEIVKSMKTKSGARQVDLHPSVSAVLLADRPGSGQGLMFCTKNGTPFLPGNVERRRLRDYWSGGFHGFRRFRNTHLRSVGCLEDLRMFWLGHKPSSMGEVYSKLSRDAEKRLAEAEKVGLGFEVKEGCFPRPWPRLYCVGKYRATIAAKRRKAIEEVKDRLRKPKKVG